MKGSFSMSITGLACALGLLTATSCTKEENTRPETAYGTGVDAAQASQGSKVYADHCAKCHGDNGEGKATNPPVVGPTALPMDPPAGSKYRKVQFHTAADVYKFVHDNMPADKPGSLSEDDYLAVMAFALNANGISINGRKLDTGNAGSIMLHQ